MQKAIYHIIACLTAIVFAAGASAHAGDAARAMAGTLADTIIDRRHKEVDDITMRMVQSAYPVQINIVGNAVCIKSNYNQLLPVYTESGSFYAAFRLNKGTNWLSGLPRGTYFINNRKVAIP